MNVVDRFFDKYPMLKGSIPYFIIGGVSTAAELIIYFLLCNGGISMYVANIIGKISGLTLSFTLNAFLNFKVKDKLFVRLIMFYGVGILGLLFSNGILYLGVERLMLNGTIVKFCSIPIVGIFQFLVNKFVTFSKKIKNKNT